ncbi:nuclear transport factor 2 family protein [Actinoplanes sp. LDG1-06]|uniref:Nuclear transport factor 2 family protein n=1 Tax=Paractinoplanes ovalisporus TaxID=2810368 RepID=A0ABS2A2Y8_9ACTN|nr:nuclear transport factor 2 family protein [Actinoplanes ovalisporus]MBM2614208.1 nuclear transport factor 2 family protein [Actinoplanes ovalisporus]
MDVSRLATEHVSRFNRSVTAKDFTDFVESFADNANLAFDRARVGPFKGRDAIALAYRVSPPDDTIELVGIDETGPGDAVVQFAWTTDPHRRTGEMLISWTPDEKVRNLEVRLP